MNIEVKYPVGYQFYVPRVYERRNKETIKHPDSTGVIREYSRDVITLEAIVKHKVVEYIDIHITDCVKIRYWCKDVQSGGMATIVPECEMNIIDSDIALQIANRILNEQKPYYG
jgi:hypothetical protein